MMSGDDNTHQQPPSHERSFQHKIKQKEKSTCAHGTEEIEMCAGQGRQLLTAGGLEEEEEEEEEEEVVIEQEEKSIDYGSYKWMVVFACYLMHFILGGFERSDGILYLKLIKKFNKSAQTTAWVGSLASTFRLMLGPIACAISNKFSSRVTVMCGGLVFSAGVLLSGFAPNIMVVILTFSVIGGIGRSLVYSPGMVTVAQYFHKKPGFAVGLATSGAGAGTLVVPVLVDIMFEEYNFLSAFIILSVIPLNMCVAGALFRPLDIHMKILEQDRKRNRRKKALSLQDTRGGPIEDNEDLLMMRTSFNSEPCGAKQRKPSSLHNGTSTENGHKHSQRSLLTEKDVCIKFSEHDKKPSGLRKLLPKSSSKEEEKKKKEEKKLLDLSLMKDPTFLFFCFSIGIYTLAFKAAFTFLPPLAKDHGCTEREASLLMSVLGVSDAVFRALSGVIMELKPIRHLRPYIYNVGIILVALLFFISPSLTTFWEFSVICVMYGALTGAYVSQKSVVLVDILGIDKLSSSFGIMIWFQGMGTLIGPPLSGVCKDVFGGYGEAFYFGGGCMIVSAILMAFSNVCLRMHRTERLAEKTERLAEKTKRLAKKTEVCR